MKYFLAFVALVLLPTLPSVAVGAATDDRGGLGAPREFEPEAPVWDFWAAGWKEVRPTRCAQDTGDGQSCIGSQEKCSCFNRKGEHKLVSAPHEGCQKLVDAQLYVSCTDVPKPTTIEEACAVAEGIAEAELDDCQNGCHDWGASISSQKDPGTPPLCCTSTGMTQCMPSPKPSDD